MRNQLSLTALTGGEAMIATDTLATRADGLADLIEQKLGVRGKGLERKLRKAGRLLPRYVRREAAQIVAAQRLTAHPKLMMQTDPSALDRAFRQCERWLKTVDPAKRRRDKVLKFLGLNAMNMLVVTAAFVAYLVWSGHV